MNCMVIFIEYWQSPFAFVLLKEQTKLNFKFQLDQSQVELLSNSKIALCSPLANMLTILRSQSNWVMCKLLKNKSGLKMFTVDAQYKHGSDPQTFCSSLLKCNKVFNTCASNTLLP